MTAIANKLAIEKAGPLPSGITFSYFGTDRPLHHNMALARSQNWYRFAHWMRESLTHAKKLHDAQPFDLAHHLTLGTVRVASPLWQLPIPFVLGPCGGGELIPLPCFASLRLREAVWESARYLDNLFLRASTSVRRCVRNAEAAIGSTRKSCNLLRNLGAEKSRISRLPSVFISESERKCLRSRACKSDPRYPLTMITGGVLDGRKGMNLALSSVALAKRMGASVRFIVTCIGPELDHLSKLASKLGLESEVCFQPALTRSDYLQQLSSTDVFFLPSLRDTGPTSLIEAMMAGCVPLVVDCNGPGEHVIDGTGIKVAPTSGAEMARRFACIIADLSARKDALMALGDKASVHARSTFSEKVFSSALNDVYRAATAARRDSSATYR